MNDFMIDFKEIQGQDAANTIVDVFIDSVLDEKGLRLNIVNDFFAQCLHNLENPSTNPKAKFYTLYMLKQLSQKDKITRKLFGPFSKHELYAYLEGLALTVDPMKVPEDKGKSLFPGDKATGNNFMRLLLQSMLNWGTRFGSTKDRPTRFTTTMEKLNKAKVVMPANMIYYAKKVDKAETPSGPEPKNQESKKKMTQDSIGSTPSVVKVKDSKDKYASEIKFMFNKVELLLSIIEDTDEAQQIQRQVNSNHQKFVKDQQKLQAQQEQMLEGQAQDIISLYFKLLDFYEEEKKLFNLHAKNNDYGTYISGYAIAVEKIFDASKLRNEPPKKQEPSIESKINKPSKPDIPKPNAAPSKPYISSKPEESLSRQNLRSQGSRNYDRQNRFTEASRFVDNFFSKLQRCSKSPANVYGNIAKSMSKEKQSTVVTRKKNPMTISQFTKSRYGGSSVARSTVQLKGIFAAPPNPGIRPRNYEGELVLQLREIDYVLQSILRQQGHRRFKASHFKDKYVLYEDESIQIGFKLAQIYQKVQKFSSMMMFELYFGNKTEQILKRFTLQFHGDKQSLIYTSPQVVDETIRPMSQIKLQLLNIPQRIPFGHITVQVSYEVERESRHVSAYLPNSILHMVAYYQIQTHQYSKSWSNCVKILKSEAFKLSHYFPPDQLKVLIPSLKENTSYYEFNRPGSTIDYELFTEVIIQQSYQGILKINVRPDLSVVLQAGIYESQENCLKNFRFYLQGLEMVLKSHLE